MDNTDTLYLEDQHCQTGIDYVLTNIVTISNYICKAGFCARIGKKLISKFLKFFLMWKEEGDTAKQHLLIYFSVVVFFS